MDYCNYILQLNKYKLNVSTTPKIRSSKPGCIEEHLHHQHLIKTKKPSLAFLRNSIAYGFKRYRNMWDNQFGKQIVNCDIKGDRTKKLLHRIEDLVIALHVRKIAIICGTNNLDRHRSSDNGNALICAASLILLKQKQIKIIVHDILPRNKQNSLRRQKLLQTNSMLKEKCSQVPNIAYLQPESDWVKTNTELQMAYFYKGKLHLIEEGYQKLASSISKKLKEVTNSNHVPSITLKKTPNKFMDKDFPSLKSVTKVPTNDTSYTSTAFHYKLALLKGFNPTKNKECQILGSTIITYNDGTI